MIEPNEFFAEYGYFRDREQRLRELADNRPDSLAAEAANQIKHLKSALRDLVSIVEIHINATKNNFAWAEIDEAKLALGTTQPSVGVRRAAGGEQRPSDGGAA